MPMTTATAGRKYRSFTSRPISHSDRVARLERLAWIMDGAIAIPGTRIRLGADAAIGLVPGVGDVLAQAIAAYMIYEAHRMGVPKHKLLRMGGNIVADMVFGAIPLFGDVFDVFWRANSRNLKILRDHIDRQAPARSAR
ncbi:DUF4112 domain-containing protein [Flaviflagellibacter deserti]|uniref:DUF4112 domain-containing protein n=1 Tax=Flaviflagellibacter deserti TaxID=2267266 RepID=A0ABV9Z665_9HYPH